MESRDRTVVATLIVVVIATAVFLWSPIDVYSSLVLVASGFALVAVPGRSIREWLRIVSRRTGVRWELWALLLAAFLAFVRATKWLGAPDVLVWGSHTSRPILHPTRYGIGTTLVLFGGFATTLAAGFGAKYRILSSCPPGHSSSSGRATVAGRLDTGEQTLTTPIEGDRAIWYVYEVSERSQDGFFAGNWLPVASGERSTRCRVSGAQGSRHPVTLRSVRLIPTFEDANVRYAEQTVGPNKPLPDGVAHLERTVDDGRNGDRTSARRYRVWYLAPNDTVVANGLLGSEPTEAHRVIRGGDAPTLLGAGMSYREICSSLSARALLSGGIGLILLLAGIVLVALAL